MSAPLMRATYNVYVSNATQRKQTKIRKKQNNNRKMSYLGKQYKLGESLGNVTFVKDVPNGKHGRQALLKCHCGSEFIGYTANFTAKKPRGGCKECIIKRRAEINKKQSGIQQDIIDDDKRVGKGYNKGRLLAALDFVPKLIGVDLFDVYKKAYTEQGDYLGLYKIVRLRRKQIFPWLVSQGHKIER